MELMNSSNITELSDIYTELGLNWVHKAGLITTNIFILVLGEF